MSRITVRKYLQLDEPPRKNGNRTNIESFNKYLQSRMEEDKNIEVLQLWKEIKELGYTGGRTAVYVHLKDYVKPRNRIRLPSLNYISWIPSKVSLLLYRKEESLSQKEKDLLKVIMEKCSDIGTAQSLVHKFRDMIESKQACLLKGWMDEVQQSSIKEHKGFATVAMSVPLSCNNTEKLCRAQCQVICLPKPASSHHFPKTLLAPSAVGYLNIKPVFRSPNACLAIE